ncbi:MAG: GNAT family N-acetyltransferase [Polyangiaceae bacterium]
MSDTERERPEKIRLSKLQEVQVPDVAKVEAATAAMYYELNFDAAEVPTRSQTDIVQLTRTHNVWVAEADYKVAGYCAFRDEAPGVAYVEELSVHPDYQRFGVGRRLFEKIVSEARDLGLTAVVLKVWERAEWANAFYDAMGMKPIRDDAPAKVRQWLEERSQGQVFQRPGEGVRWVTTEASDDDD